MLTIDRGVPLPPAPKKTGYYPVRQMSVGDSFAVKVLRGDAVTTRTRLHNAMGHYRRTLGYGLTVRIVKEAGVEMVRVWRTA